MGVGLRLGQSEDARQRQGRQPLSNVSVHVLGFSVVWVSRLAPGEVPRRSGEWRSPREGVWSWLLAPFRGSRQLAEVCDLHEGAGRGGMKAGTAATREPLGLGGVTRRGSNKPKLETRRAMLPQRQLLREPIHRRLPPISRSVKAVRSAGGGAGSEDPCRRPTPRTTARGWHTG